MQILWWMDGCDNESDRGTLVEEKPYKNGPDEIGVFALRSPERPNPIAVSNVNIAYVDVESGTVGLYYIDAFDGSKPTIETDRIVIRPMTIEDVTDLKEWMPDKSIYTYWGKGPSKTEKNPELLFEKENKATKSFHLGISVKDLDKVIGDLWVYLIEKDLSDKGKWLIHGVIIMFMASSILISLNVENDIKSWLDSNC